jgi:CDP-6-deoxy-D-xylo-4-hexulose-3-dehydrase
MSDYWYPLAVPTLGEEEIAAATEVLRSGKTTMGEKVEEFEAAFAEKVGAKHAIMVNSGSSADLLIALAMKVRGEVLIPAVTWPTHVWSWKMAGFDPILVDVSGLNTTPDILEQAITPDTVAVSIPHIMGIPARMDHIRSAINPLWITEDCCEALGATYKGEHVGNAGVASAWSFFFSHHMTTMEGGMVTTPSRRFAERFRTLRSHGWARHLDKAPEGLDPRYTFIGMGLNVRPMEIQAAIGLVQLTKLDEMNAKRAANYRLFAAEMIGNERVDLPLVSHLARPSMFGIPMFVDDAADLARWLELDGVETRPILGGNLARQPGFKGLGMARTPLPGADYVHSHGLYVGLHPKESDVERLALLVKKWARR